MGNTDFSLDRGLPSSPDAEKAILGAIILENSHLSDSAANLAASDFYLDAHRRIFAAMAAMLEESTPIDTLTLAIKLGDSKDVEAVGGIAYLSSLTDGVPRRDSIAHYVRIVRDKAALRSIIHAANGIAARALDQSDSVSDVLADAKDRFSRIDASEKGENWRSLYHTYEELKNAPPLRFAINGFLQEDGVTMIGGPSGDGKTLMMLAVARSLLTGEPLFGYAPFSVPVKAERVIYLIPEVSATPWWNRLEMFGLAEFLLTGKLLTRTLSSKQPMDLTDSVFLQSVKGAHVILDTAIRFIDGDESASSETKMFAQKLFDVQAAGAKSVMGAHHSPKSFRDAEDMTLENVLRGSGDIGSMLSTCWGIRQVDRDSTRIFVKNVKPRDFQACEPFVIEGRPHIDQIGTFQMVAEPGEAGSLSDYKQQGKPGRKPPADLAERQEQARSMRKAGESFGLIASKLKISKSLAFKWASGDQDSVHQ